MYTPSGSTKATETVIAEAVRALFPEGLNDYERLKTEHDSWVSKATSGW